ncbi:MAG TPA: hypothetical protein VGV37_07165 [Aliidongia sp.]|uniref:hypothetical protein n=1 Tax=Aliidongia sp. TaxID=1914230 RepID=UPI002DDD97FA|nr:hypothetical protein [Aliidongia sp.]HEV2674306.1 hypothetical protein [Aliidongia sp.]
MSFISFRAAAVLLSLLSIGPFARADEGIDPRFLTLLKSDAHRAAVLKVATEQAQGLPTPCANTTYRPVGEVGFFLPPQFDGGGRLTHGLWREQVIAEGCGTIDLLNVFSLADPTGEPKLLGGLPGTTRADLALQREGLPLVMHGLPKEAAECRDVRAVDSALSPDAPKEMTAPWREVWTVLACDKAYPVPLRFTPGVNGATIALDVPPHS